MEAKGDNRSTEPKPEASPESCEQIQLKAGTYMLHVFIEEARSLIPPGNEEMCDPVFAVTAFGVTKSTKEFSKVTSISTPKIFEHLYIESKGRTAEEVSGERVTITVKDNSLLNSSKNIIGSHEIDMIYIYSSETHGIFHRWIVLSNPEETNFGVLRGYLKIGVSLLHEKDKPVDLTKKENPSEQDKELLIPPHVNPKAVQLKIQLLKGENLPKMDRTSTLDAYCVVRFAAAECKSSVILADKATLTAYWFEEILIPVLTPCVTSTVTLTFWDHDTLDKDDLVGGIILNFDRIKKGKLNKYFWANMYGAAQMASGDAADYMNRVPSAGSHWRGRILLRAWAEENVKETYKKCIKIQDPKISEFVRDEFETGDDYELRVQVFSASALPEKSGKYSVRVEWSGIMAQSIVVETKNGCVDWFETLRRKTTMIPKGCEDVLPDIFVYLVCGDEKISFLRLPAKGFQDKAAEAKWRQLVPDKCSGKGKEEWNAGFIKVRVYAGKFDPDNDDVDKNGWKKIVKPEVEDWNLYIHTFQCRDLPAADKNGLADPYIKVYCAGEEVPKDKEPRECTLNPRWYETYHMKIKIPSTKESAPIVVYVYDYDLIGSDDILGVTFIEMTEASIEPDSVPRPKWRDISLGRKGTEKGKILMSFSLFKRELKTPFNIVPEFEDKNIQINILGLRDLKPAVGWLPVNKAFVKFDLNALNLPGESTGLKSIETQPFDSGSDPNINSTVSFKCKMPIDSIYSPYLTATVHDYLFHGLSQPLIGSFCINLGKYSSKYFSNTIVSYGLTYKRLHTEKHSLVKISESGENESDEDKNPIEKSQTSVFEYKEEKTEDFEEIQQDEEEKKEFIPDTRTKEDISSVPRRSSTKVQPSEDLSSLDNTLLQSSLPSRAISRLSISEEQRLKIQLNKEELSKISVLTFEEICSHKDYIIRKAVYEAKKKNVRKEVNIPDPDLYLPIGYNRTLIDENKYYRYYIKEPLEATYIFENLPFEEIIITKGQERGLEDSVFEFDKQKDESGQSTSVKTVGKFKFLLRMTEFPPPEPDDQDEFFNVSRKLLNKTKCVVRVYIVDAFDLEQKDKLSKSDPYVRLKLGDCVYSDRENYQENVDSMNIYKSFDLPIILPGKSMLKIQVWDYNSLTSDSKIGTTRIDLEDRFFNDKWLTLEEKPIETRPLFLQSARRPQGYIRLWLEILEGASQKLKQDISIRPPSPFEARVIIWKASDFPAMDPEGLSDAFVSVSINNSIEKETDTHYRCGRSPSWNWRMKFQLLLSSNLNENNMKIQLWDRDILSQNDFVSEANVDFSEIAKKAWEEDCIVHQMGTSDELKERMIGKESNVFWLQCKYRDDSGEEKNRGKVLVSLELVPKKKAEAIPVGEGRDEPNVHPTLPPPTGRLQLTWNPLKMMFQMVGPELKCKLCMLCICGCLVLLMVMVIPIFLGDEIAKIF